MHNLNFKYTIKVSLIFLQRKADGSIQIVTRMVIKGDIQPEKRIVLDAEDIMQSFPSVYDFSLDLNGESLRVVTIAVLLF